MSKKHLHLGDGFTLPIDIATETAAILAVKRAGKSNAGVVIAEELFDAGVPWTAVDPKGDWWGVRAAGDGKAKGLPVVVFGGEHADVPLEPTSGKLLARLVAQKRLTCVLDVSTMSKADQRHFLTDFAEELYRLNREPMHLFCEEADEYIPQQVRGESARMVGAFETLVKRGGFRGIGVTLITQRSASLNKDVLTQAGTLVAMRTPSPQDRKAVLAWIEQHAASKEVIDELPKLASGEAWVFSTLREPELQKVKFRRRRTFDSGATPKVGEKITPPATLADVDLAAISAEMAETIERAKAEDPKELRKQVAALKAELAQARAAKPAPAAKVEYVEKPALKAELVKRLEQVQDRAQTRCSDLKVLLEEEQRSLKMVGAALHAAAEIANPRPPGFYQRLGTTPASRPVPVARPAAVPKPRPVAGGSGDPELGDGGAMKILIAVAQHDGGCTREQLSILIGLKRSSRDTYLQRLRAKGYVAQDGERVVITDAGSAALPPSFEPLPTGAALLDYWREKLGNDGERVILDALVEQYPAAVQRDEIAAVSPQTGEPFKRSSRDTYLQRLRARQLITEPGRGLVRAADMLFDNPGGTP